MYNELVGHFCFFLFFREHCAPRSTGAAAPQGYRRPVALCFPDVRMGEMIEGAPVRRFSSHQIRILTRRPRWSTRAFEKLVTLPD
jgi:hypothetical protein